MEIHVCKLKRKVAKSQSKHNFICEQISYMFRLYVAIIRMNIQPYKIGIMILTYLLHGAESFLRIQLVLAASKEIPRSFGTQRFITVLTNARHLSLS